MKTIKYVLLVSGLVLLVGQGVEAAQYEIDPGHSQIGFRIRHIVAKTRGHFEKFSGSINYDSKKPQNLKAEAVIETKSVNTNQEKRDEHLKTKDFFDVSKHPTMVFKSTKAKIDKDGQIILSGNLTLLGVTKPVDLEVELGGEAKDPWGNMRAGFSAKGTISRKAFGMDYNSPPGVIGDEVEILLDIEAVEKK